MLGEVTKIASRNTQAGDSPKLLPVFTKLQMLDLGNPAVYVKFLESAELRLLRGSHEPGAGGQPRLWRPAGSLGVARVPGDREPCGPRMCAIIGSSSSVSPRIAQRHRPLHISPRGIGDLREIRNRHEDREPCVYNLNRRIALIFSLDIGAQDGNMGHFRLIALRVCGNWPAIRAGWEPGRVHWASTGKWNDGIRIGVARGCSVLIGFMITPRPNLGVLKRTPLGLNHRAMKTPHYCNQIGIVLEETSRLTSAVLPPDRVNVIGCSASCRDMLYMSLLAVLRSPGKLGPVGLILTMPP